MGFGVRKIPKILIQITGLSPALLLTGCIDMSLSPQKLSLELSCKMTRI
jgi:hypothetical protein